MALKVTSIQYIEIFLSHFLQDTAIGKLTSHEFVFCLFLAGGIGRFTNLTFAREANENMNDFNIAIPEELEEIAVSHIPKLTVDEVGVVAHAFYKTGLLIRTKNFRLRNSLLNFTENIEDRGVISSQLAIAAVAKLLTERGSLDYDRVGKLMQKYQPLMHRLNKDASIRFEFI